MPSLNSTSFKVLQMIVVLQERHHLNQSAIPVLNEFILDILSSFATELEVRYTFYILRSNKFITFTLFCSCKLSPSLVRK